MCCANGKVKIPSPPKPPPELLKFFDINQSGQSFLPLSRAYNNALALASIGCEQFFPTGFNPTFTIQGKLCHKIGSLLPSENNSPKFAQIFFNDSDNELANRVVNAQHHSLHLDPDILKCFQESLHANNSYVRSFKSAVEVCKTNDVKIVLHAKKPVAQNEHSRTLNLPSTSEVAALIPGDAIGNLDVIVRCRSGDGQELRRINTCHRAYDPLHYVLMFPFGCDGWHLGLTRTDNKTLTAADFYSYRLQIRQEDFNIIFKLQKLMQQYAVDQWAKIEGSRLDWARRNQKSIRAEKYQGLMDAVHSGDNVNVGVKIILPPTIYGSPRFYSEAFQNAMAIVRQLGKPDLFITFTCNPKWPEISAVLNPGERPCDRPDLSCRVFKQKFDSLMDDLLKKEIFGGVKAHTATIEFQKRGLPHAHILLIMNSDSKPNSPELIDRIVSAEIPVKEDNPELYKVVTSQNIHGPCGNINKNSPCMDGGHCTKNFPKPFQDETRMTETSYPQYKRRHPDKGGLTHVMKVCGKDFTVDNSFIVPYNPTLSYRYKAHINVEIVHSVQAVKYLYKYVTKGQDRILMAVQEEQCADEITNYQNARYISASEAFWRLYGFEIHRKHPSVEKLPCHLPGQQTVLFQPGDAQHVAERGPPTTKLTAYFDKNQEDPEARNILYSDFPRYFTWNTQNRKWQRRKRGATNPDNPNEYMSDAIGRIPTISLSAQQAELYYLRMLLHHKRGATSFDDLKTIDGVSCQSFQEACRQLGLLEDDTEKDNAMMEASSVRFGPQLRLAFATILMYCRPADPLEFWNRHKFELCRDFMLRDRVEQINHQVQNEALIHIQSILDNDCLLLHEHFNLPKPDQEQTHDIPKVISDELNHDPVVLKDSVQAEYPKLNHEQKEVFNTVMDSITNGDGKIIALDASGGTGKTHTINLILAAVRSQKKIALATAMSGIAATLLSGGRTLHSRCKVPICVHEHSVCSMSPRDATGKLLQQAVLLVIDEVSMGHRHIFEAIDRTMKDIRGNDSLFGGLTVLFAGDWRQILPVVRHGSRSQIVDSALKSSYLWPHVTVLKLIQNMRVLLTGESSDFSDYLLSIGDGRQEINNEIGEFAIKLPQDLLVKSEQELMDFVFDDLDDKYTDPFWLSSRSIICPTNLGVDQLNEKLMDKFPGDERVYLSHDSVEENEHQYPIEFINSLSPSGMPPHTLRLKKHCVIMLLRNLDPANGHCNGTRYIVDQLHDHILDAVIACGPHTGKRLFIPRIPLCPSDNVFPFHMTRRQFPVRPSFAITANKSQGQTLKKIGIYLNQDFFSHGQLYVALSRVGSRDSVRLLTAGQVPGVTNNVVYREILRN